MDAQRTPINYWVAEQWDDGKLVARWTSRRPGKTGPPDLARHLDALRADGWRVYAVSASGDPRPQRRRTVWTELVSYASRILRRRGG